MLSTSSDSDLTNLELFLIATILVSIFMGVGYFVVWSLEKYRHSGVKKNVQDNKSKLNKLENDYTWRLVKVIYISISIVVTCISSWLAYNSTIQGIKKVEWNGLTSYSTPSGPSVSKATLTFIVTAGIFWIIYVFLLPKIYAYLKPLNSSNHPGAKKN